MIDWDDAFDNSSYVAGADRLPERWSDAASAFRADAEAAGRADIDLAYGPAARNRVDLFRPAGNPAGLVVFVHGGYWHKLDKTFWSQLAAGPLAADWAVAIPSYTLAPAARITEITREICAAIEFVADRVDGPLRLAGHSAGGHLVSRMVCTDIDLSPALRARLEKIVSISGVHDLRPLTLTRMNEILRLDADEAAAESPALQEPVDGVDIAIWVGAGERPEFLRQARLLAERWQRPGVTDHYEPGRDHFSVVEGLADPASPLVAELLRDREPST